MKNQVGILKSAAAKLENAANSAKVIAGFDGFIDEIITAVDVRFNENSYEPIKNITNFGNRILAGAGKSCGIELVTNSFKLGGNGPIMANALLKQGYDISYIGALGYPEIKPIFDEFYSKCSNVYSLANPGYTQAIEFEDGKVMLGKIDDLANVNLENLIAKAGERNLKKIIKDAKLAAFTNWTMIPKMNPMLEYFANINPELTIFVDLADPKKRHTKDIKEVLMLLSKLNCKVILGLNEGESERIALVLGIDEDNLVKRCEEIQKKLAIWAVVVHPVKNAVACVNGQNFEVQGPYCKKPKLSTGAGDNFNSGFVNGILQNLSFDEALALGVCTSGFYVRNAFSPNKQELISFINKWAALDCGEI